MEINKLKEILTKHEFVKYMAFKNNENVNNAKVLTFIESYEKHENEEVYLTFTTLRVGKKSFTLPETTNNVITLRKTLLTKYIIEEAKL